MKVTVGGQLPVESVKVSFNGNPENPRLHVDAGRWRLSVTEAEAVLVVEQILDALAELRNQSARSTTAPTMNGAAK